MEKDELQYLLDNLSRKEICQSLNISNRTLDRMIRKHVLTRENFGRKGLNQKDFDLIHRMYKTGGLTQKDLAALFGVSQSLISKILNNVYYKKFKHLKISGEAKVRKG